MAIGGAAAQSPEPAPAPVEAGAEAEVDPVTRYRQPFDVLANRAIGTASRPVEFNWRRSPVHLAATGAYLAELNNFNSLRTGGIIRLPSERGLLLEFGADYVDTWDSDASELLALTPYRQAGRPDRMELNVSLEFPLAEGVVTAFPRFFPAVQMVFGGYAGVRYMFYPTGFRGLRVGQIAGAVLSPTLRTEEIDNLDDARLDAMEVDPGRYVTLVGFGNELYFKSGVFVAPRVMVAVPLLAPASETRLLVWPELSLAIGIAL